MAKPYVLIRITTYADLDRREVGLAVWQALEDTSPRLLPEKAGYLRSLTRVITSAEDLARVWDCDRNMYSQTDRKAPQVRSGVVMGVEWKRSTPLRNSARFSHPGPRVYDSQFEFKSDWRRSIDWWALFDRLCAVMTPSFAMLHPYAGAEADGPFKLGIAGEFALSAHVGEDGSVRRVDHFDARARQTYRRLPDLPWACCFGPQFDGQYRRQQLVAEAARVVERDGRLMFTVSDGVADVVEQPALFEERRRRLKSCFTEGFFA